MIHYDKLCMQAGAKLYKASASLSSTRNFLFDDSPLRSPSPPGYTLDANDRRRCLNEGKYLHILSSYGTKTLSEY